MASIIGILYLLGLLLFKIEIKLSKSLANHYEIFPRDWDDHVFGGFKVILILGGIFSMFICANKICHDIIS